MHLQSAIENLHKRSSDIEHYYNLIGKIQTTDVSADEDFQREFNYFYKVRRNAEWRNAYYALFEETKTNTDTTFEYILLELYSRTGNIEASFSSKMLANINPEMPIWDSLVLAQLGLTAPVGNSEKRLSETIDLYSQICSWYQEFRRSSSWQVYVDSFDQEFPEYKSISDIKKIDFILWAGDPSDTISSAGKTISRITIKSSSGYCPVDYAYDDKLTVTADGISYEYKPYLVSEENPVRKWRYSSNTRFCKDHFQSFAGKLPVILNRIDTSMFATDIGATEFIITYSDKSRVQKEYWLPSDMFSDALIILRNLIPPCEEIPEVLKTEEDYSDEDE